MEPAAVVQKAYDWALWIIPKVEKFPKSYRFSIGQSLIAASIELLMNRMDATYQTRNVGSLAPAVREVNRIRYLVRLAKDEFAAGDGRSGADNLGTSSVRLSERKRGLLIPKRHQIKHLEFVLR